MALQEKTFYGLQCDEPGCEKLAGEEGEYAHWSDADNLIDTARDWDWDVLDLEQPAYCEKHRKPRCIYCDGRDEHMVSNAGDEPVCTQCAKTEDLT